MRGTPEFVWSELERPELVTELTETLRTGASVIVWGEAGVGKTTVARQAMTRFDDAVWVQAFEGLSDTALAPLSLAAGEAADSVMRAHRWLHAIADAGAVLFIDDGQWLDSVSAGLLRQAAADLRIVMTVRSGHGLAPDLAREAALQRWAHVSVPPFDAEMTGAAVEQALSERPDAQLVRTLSARSAGNPLVLRELLTEGVASGAVERDADGWQLQGELAASLGLVQLFTARVDRLSDEERQLLELVSVAGRMPHATLDGLASGSILARLEESNVLRSSDGFVAVEHPMLAEAMRASMSSARRRALLRDLVAAADGSAWSQHLRWRLELDDEISAAELDDGYERAVASLDHALSAQIAEAGFSRYPTVRNGLRYANVLHHQQQQDRAREVLAGLVALAQSEDDVARLASHVVRTQGVTGPFLGVEEPDLELSTETAAWADARLASPVVGDIATAAAVMIGGDFEAGVQVLMTHLDAPYEAARIDVHELLAIEQFFQHDPTSLLEHAAVLVEPVDGYYVERPHVIPPAIAYAGGLLRDQGIAAADRFTADLMEDVERQDVSAVTVFEAALARASVCIYTDIAEGLDAARLGAAHADAGGAYSAYYTMCLYADLLAYAGRVDDAVGVLEQAGSAEAVASLVTVPVFQGNDVWFRAEVEALHQTPDAIAPELVRRARELGAAGDAQNEARLLALCSRVVVPEEATVARLEELATPDQVQTSLDAAFARARRAADLNALEAVTAEYAGAGFAALAAEAAARAVDLARAQGVEGERYSRLRFRYRELLNACPGLRHRRVMIESETTALTDRERQIAELGALGWSNKEIAEQLSVSVRTVENNLQRVYKKLGINRRTQLAGALETVAA